MKKIFIFLSFFLFSSFHQPLTISLTSLATTIEPPPQLVINDPSLFFFFSFLTIDHQLKLNQPTIKPRTTLLTFFSLSSMKFLSSHPRKTITKRHHLFLSVHTNTRQKLLPINYFLKHYFFWNDIIFFSILNLLLVKQCRIERYAPRSLKFWILFFLFKIIFLYF